MTYVDFLPDTVRLGIDMKVILGRLNLANERLLIIIQMSWRYLAISYLILYFLSKYLLKKYKIRYDIAKN